MADPPFSPILDSVTHEVLATPQAQLQALVQATAFVLGSVTRVSQTLTVRSGGNSFGVAQVALLEGILEVSNIPPGYTGS